MSTQSGITTRRSRSRNFAIGIAGGSVALGTIGVADSPVEATYATPWTRSDAYSLGITGIYEKYDGTASHSVWSDNDLQDEAGADCSGYANKVWAVQYQRAISYDDHGAGSTLTWWNNSVDGSVEIGLGDARSLQMDAWVFRRSNSTGHMGVFEGGRDQVGNYKIWEAASSSYPIRNVYKAPSYFSSSSSGGVTTYASKRFKRVNW